MLLRLLALVLIVAFSLTMFPVTADADFSGFFDNTTSVGDLDDDFDEVIRRLRPPAAADSPVAVFNASVSPTLHLPFVFSGAGPMSWTGRPPADRGPPAGLARHPIHSAPPRVAPAPRFQPVPQHFPFAPPLEPSAHHRPRSERNSPWQA
jgi:hypothetical protein